jgi:vacuolar-type H+-ATPase subunit H
MNDQPTPQGSEGQTPAGGPPPLRESVSSAGERIQVIIEAAEKAAAGIIEDADAQARRYIDTSRQRADVLADERVRVMSDLTDTLIRQAEMVRRQSDELLAALDSARGELASRIGQELSSGTAALAGVPPAPAQDQPPAQASRVPHLQPVESERRPDLQAVEPPAAPQPTPQAQPPQSSSPAPQQSAPQPPQDTAPAAPPPPSGAHSAATIPSDGARLLAAQMAVAGSSREEIETRLRDEFGIQDAAPILDGILGPG